MTSFFHSFVRPRLRPEDRTNLDKDKEDRQAAAILESIFEFGIVCSPERLNIYSDRTTQNVEKQLRLKSGDPEYTLSQSRFCLTLCEASELYEPEERGIRAREAAPPGSGPDDTMLLQSHADLFGPWAIGFDPIASRRLGILPTIYFAPTDMFGQRVGHSSAPGLSVQMIQRLKETRELLVLLALIEADLKVGEWSLPSLHMIDSLGYDLPFEVSVVSGIRALSAEQRRQIFQHFNIDRGPALDLVSHLEMMMGLFQETDSTLDGTPYAFYEQKEWRLIHHMRDGMVWYSLGRQPSFRDPLAPFREEEVGRLRTLLQAQFEPRNETYFESCWVLEAVDDQLVSNYVSMVIVPRRSRSLAAAVLDRFGAEVPLFDAEEFGYRESDVGASSRARGGKDEQN